MPHLDLCPGLEGGQGPVAVEPTARGVLFAALLARILWSRGDYRAAAALSLAGSEVLDDPQRAAAVQSDMDARGCGASIMDAQYLFAFQLGRVPAAVALEPALAMAQLQEFPDVAEAKPLALRMIK